MQPATDYGHPQRKQPSLHGRKFNPNPKFLGTAEAYFVCHIGPIFQISLIYAFIWCPQSVVSALVNVHLWTILLCQVPIGQKQSILTKQLVYPTRNHSKQQACHDNLQLRHLLFSCTDLPTVKNPYQHKNGVGVFDFLYIPPFLFCFINAS